MKQHWWMFSLTD